MDMLMQKSLCLHVHDHEPCVDDCVPHDLGWIRTTWDMPVIAFCCGKSIPKSDIRYVSPSGIVIAAKKE